MIDLATAAVLRMLALGSRMSEYRSSHDVDSPGYVDMVTSMCDLRAGLNIARGVPIEHITSLGYPSLDYARERRRDGH